MKVFNWNHEKNEILKRERGVSFEAVAFCIENGLLLDIVEHPNQDKYKGTSKNTDFSESVIE